jgi:hypothetical protein
VHGDDEQPLPIAPAVIALPLVRPPRTRHTRIDVPGGWIVITPTNIDAHCSDPRHAGGTSSCSTNSIRTPENLDKTKEGRRAAYLMAWLAHAKDCPDKAAHKAAVSRSISNRPQKSRDAMSLDIRQTWRKWLTDNQPLIIGAERPKRSTEPEEQPIL